MNIILASSSPRRKELLSQIGVDFAVVKPHLEEKVREQESPESVVMSLAFQKAMEVFEKCDDESIIVASDTVVVYENVILGKPVDTNNTLEMLKMLNGRSHKVYTGLAFVNKENKYIDYEVTEVVFNDNSDEWISKYIGSTNTLDKAGGYGIQGVGSILVDKINGDYYNVMGLPLSLFVKIMKDVFDYDFFDEKPYLDGGSVGCEKKNKGFTSE